MVCFRTAHFGLLLSLEFFALYIPKNLMPNKRSLYTQKLRKSTTY